MRRLAALLLMSAAGLAETPSPPKPDPEAEELVKKLEAKVAAAKTFSAKITMEVATDDEKPLFEVALDFKEGNRARLGVTGKASDGKSPFALIAVCDGKKVSRSDPSGEQVDDAEAGLAAKARALAVRAPIRDLTLTLGGKAPKKAFSYTAFAFEDDEKVGERTARVVSYTATRGAVVLHMKIWIDAEKLELLKREMVEKKGDKVTTRVTDTVTAWAVDGEIKDETFSVEEPKGGGEPKEEK